MALGELLGSSADPPASREEWMGWAELFREVEADLHRGTAGWVDTTFYARIFRTLEAGDPPPEARAVVELIHGAASWEWPKAASAARLLLGAGAAEGRWIPPALLLDVAVAAHLATGERNEARRVYRMLAPLSDRPPGDLRNRLLDRLVTRAEAGPSRRD